jgi:hypothetical protein
MPIKIPKVSSSNLGRSNVLTVRLDPKTNYLCDIAARIQRRTKSSLIEALIKGHLESEPIAGWRDLGNTATIDERADVLWHVRESQRLVSLAIVAPHLLTFEEQQIWTLIEENGFFWRGRQWRNQWAWDVNLETIVRPRVDEFWQRILAVSNGDEDETSLPTPPIRAPKKIGGGGQLDLFNS